MGAPVMPVEDLTSSVRRSYKSRRPLLHHLNADTSWLLQLPQPEGSPRKWFNIIIDPWLSGSQSDVASWFSTQWHATAPAFGSIAKVQDLIRETERLCAVEEAPKLSPEAAIDLVLVSHEFTDHMHKQTLLELDSDVPVLATTKACALIKKWNHFKSVQETPPFSGTGVDWRTRHLDPLPEWISVSRIINEADALYYHAALLITFSVNSQSNAEAVIYTPHGIDAPCLQSVADANPPIHTLAFLHGLHDISLPKQQLNLGAHNGLKAQRLLQSNYWVATHDEKKEGRGFVGWLLRRKEFSVHDALRKEKASEDGADLPDDTGFFELKNGEVAVLS